VLRRPRVADPLDLLTPGERQVLAEMANTDDPAGAVGTAAR
jgi:hypothetical protein